MIVTLAAGLPRTGRAAVSMLNAGSLARSKVSNRARVLPSLAIKKSNCDDLGPRVNVTGFVGLLSGNVSTLFKSGSQAWAVSPTVTWPAFDLGGARARLRAQQARGDESLALYDQTVLRAIEDLQNALVAYRERQSQVVSLSQQVDASRRAASLAHVRYKEGSIDFLRVLDAERTRLEAEDSLTQAETAANVDVVTIYKALGGAFG